MAASNPRGMSNQKEAQKGRGLRSKPIPTGVVIHDVISRTILVSITVQALTILLMTGGGPPSRPYQLQPTSTYVTCSSESLAVRTWSS